MKKILLLSIVVASFAVKAQVPCSGNPVYRQFDFWIGEWDVYQKNGQKGGDSKIDLILDSCVILENWKSVKPFRGLYYTGKSFNTYNSKTNQWQQTWVDNVGGTIEFLEGHHEDNKMIFKTKPYNYSKDTIAVRRLTFFNLGPDKVRQFSEISKDGEKTWAPEYDLEYRRKKM